jgi:sugar/nucleoside kinase (ribokinase family)
MRAWQDTIMGAGEGRPDMSLDILSIGSISIDYIHSQTFFGGTAANVAVNSARLNLAAGLYSAASKSEWGLRYRAFLQDEGIPFWHPPDYLEELPEFHVTLDSSGTAQEMEFIDNGLTEAFRSVPQDDLTLSAAEIVHFGACEPSFIHKVLEIAPQDQPISYNPGGWLTYDVDYFAAAYPRASFLFLNAYEYECLLSADVVQSPLDLQKQDDQVVVITRGSSPIWVVTDGHLVEISVQKVPAVDETGAGDGFITAFLWGWINDRPLEICLQLAITFAGLVAQQYGAQIKPKSVQTFKDIAAGL